MMVHSFHLRIVPIFFKLQFLVPYLVSGETIHPNDFWLPGDVVPVHYDLSLQVNMENFTTEGEVSIEVDVVKNTKQFTLHVHPKIVTVKQSEVKVCQLFGSFACVSVEDHELDEERQFYTIKLADFISDDLAAGAKVKLVIPFKGFIRGGRNATNATKWENLKLGLYKSKDDLGGSMAVTQFESMNARSVFPCFDEPRLKSTFILKLGRTKEYRTRANTVAQKEGEELAGKPGYLWDTYTITPKMSTYLLAFAVFNATIKSSDSTSGRGVKVQAFYANASSIEHAAVVCAKMLDYFEQNVFVGINYSLPKMDIIAVPQFPGAMENWGMVTFHTSLSLYSESGRDERTVDNDNIMGHEVVNLSSYI